MAPQIRWTGRGRRAGPAGIGAGRRPAPLRQRGLPGVTLLEMLLVVGLLALLAAVALPRFATSATWAAQGDASARKVVAAMRLARRMAVDHGATNATGYRVECAGSTLRIFDLGAGAYYATPTSLADGWSFENGGWTVVFDPYGGAQVQAGQPAYAAVSGNRGRWLVHLEPATGYVWYEESK